MPTPNFFIVGAPKCGTTALATWLGEHPQVFVSRDKEPHHFNTDHDWVLTPGDDEYERLFRCAGPEHAAIGEGSVWYLHSDVAVPRIEAELPGARYIVCLRNPMEMARSLHQQQILNDQEEVEDFAEAWHLNDERMRGRAVGLLCREPRHLAYGDACLIGRQLDRLLRRVPRSRVHVCLIDDIRAEPRSAYRAVLAFLGVEDDGRHDFAVVNSARQIRWKRLRQAVRLAGSIKGQMGVRRSFRVLEAINRLNLKPPDIEPLGENLLGEMRRYFRNDVARLQSILGRDLSHWLA